MHDVRLYGAASHKPHRRRLYLASLCTPHRINTEASWAVAMKVIFGLGAMFQFYHEAMVGTRRAAIVDTKRSEEQQNRSTSRLTP